MIENKNNIYEQDFFYRVSAADFKKIPGSPVAYWVAPNILSIFGKHNHLKDVVQARNGITSGDNSIFLRFWNEVSFENVNFHAKNSIICY